MKRGFKQCGFTLIELTVVIVLAVIVGISATIFLPSQMTDVYNQVHQLASVVRLTQQYSMSGQSLFRLELRSNGYRILFDDGTPVDGGGEYTTLPPSMVLSGFPYSPVTYLVFDENAKPMLASVANGSRENGSVTFLNDNMVLKLTAGSDQRQLIINQAGGVTIQ